MASISCIIVSYNNGISLKNAVMSVLDQTLSVNEIIIADDGSTDGSRDLIEALARQYAQIKPIFREKNLGVAANRDLAIRAASSDLVTTLDGDDWYNPDKLKFEFLALTRGSSSISYSDTLLAHHEGEVTKVLDNSAFSKFDTVGRLTWLALRLGAIPRDMLLTKKLYLDVGGIRHNFSTFEDWDFKIRLASHPNQWEYSGVAGTIYRQTGAGLSSRSKFESLISQYKVLFSNQKLITSNIGYLNYYKALALAAKRETRAFLIQVSKATARLGL